MSQVPSGDANQAPASPSGPRSRTRRRRLLDALTARALSMPPGRHDYALTENVAVSMRDGVELLASVYLPTTTSRGTVLIRTPYGRATPIAHLTAGYLASHGFQVVNQSCRGTFGSGGAWSPFVQEIDDGADTVTWLRRQPWFGGRFALCGASYLGFTAWAVMMDPPPELACAVVAISAHDNFRVTHPGGAFALEGTLTLMDGLDHLEDGFVRGLARFPTAARRLRPGYRELPLIRAQETVLAGGSMPYASWLAATDADDPVWQRQRLLQALERVEVPVLLHEGWQDRFVDQTLDQYARLRDRGVDVALTIGPWTHVQVATKAGRVTMPETLDWLAEHLTGSDGSGAPRSRQRSARVRIFVTGAEEWRDLADWPPATRSRAFHLQPGGGLGEHEPDGAAMPSTFTFDPADPTPAVGGRVINPSLAGRRDNRELERRPDVLVFTGPVLTEPLEIIGSPIAELAHSSDNPHADLFVRLCEVRPNGRSVNIADGFCRLWDDDPDAIVRLPLDAVAHRFAPGSRLRLQVSGGAHPRYARNLGTADDAATATTLVPSHRTIHHGLGGSSRIVLPCVEPGGHGVTPEVTPSG